MIGLDEAGRLAAALAALERQEVDSAEVFYVDSGSRDGSPEIARQHGVSAVLAIPRAGASAARARNAGLERVSAPYVQFVDGDTVLEPGWAAEGVAALEADAGLAGVEGGLVEARPDANLYHAVCELDWAVEPGPVPYVGGNSLYRTAALREVGGFDPRMTVGEEPEIGARLRARGWRLRHLDRRMACHDLDLASFADYWRRGIRGGLACGMVVRATGGSFAGVWHERLWRTLAHAALLVAPLALGLLVLPIAPLAGLMCAALSPALFAVLTERKARTLVAAGLPPRVARAFGAHTYFGKLPAALGILVASVRGWPAGEPPACMRTDLRETDAPPPG